MRKLFFISFLSLISVITFSQQTESLSARKNIYIEIGGNGIAFNVMGETRFKPGSDGLGIKAGFGGFTTSYESLFTVPVGLNWLVSKDNKNFFEAGVGATYLHYRDKYDYTPGYPSYPTEIINLTIEQANSVYGHFTLGYRRQPPNGGIMWGVAVTPHFNAKGFWPVWAGIKFGYSIGEKTENR